ncbi:filamentous hemagglutinin family N-terminal domain protein [Cylindrospermum stagnale PCC 7417]|uniref:Filamentous hemagglutinin family N-terminal domain protein n=1 Tax=Cylindrospermum stagnale PCC 7417 TaxID=56107 RepID=K9X118_9NOST|nr:filamentous hemagglutinin N-terminal domain-containing protein [Cylindrospermum stagnale]AFZ25759.1 filamentous hemagglutinin family N-terminal domain protein [Cylindrospermum stagnale PCC 7417]
MKNKRSVLLLTVYVLLMPFTAQAQIIPDDKLGGENSLTVADTVNGKAIDRIEGGAIRGSHLFHSFQEFNVGEGQGAYFTNPTNITNIFTRVTGGKTSNILGTLGVLGNANLFLLNPKGIIFGPNAQLDVGGSFLASTADSVVFDNGFLFSATNPQAPPLLAVNIPIGLQFREHPGSIVNQSQFSRIVPNISPSTLTAVGLEVPFGQTLALVGGDLNLNSGNVTAFQGNILLGSVASPGFVSFGLTPIGLTLDYTGIQNFGNIELSGTTSVNASGLGSGSISLKGGNVTLRDRAHLISDTTGTIDGHDINIQATQFNLLDQAFIESGTSGTGAAGSVNINATDSINLRGIGFATFLRIGLEEPLAGIVNPFPRDSGIYTSTVGAGKGGNVTINTRQLTLRDGMLIASPTYRDGTGGNIAIKASESVELISSGFSAGSAAQGNGGTIEIDTNQLMIRNGAFVTTAISGQGKGGDLIVRATDSVVLTATPEFSAFSTGLSTNSVRGTGDVGNIDINTRTLLVEGGASISSTSGLTSGNRLFSSASRGGNVIINASDSVKIAGMATSNNPSDIRTAQSFVVSGAIGSGDGGDVRINTKRLMIKDRAAIGASTLDTGRGGNIVVNAAESVEIIGSNDNLSASGIATGSGDNLFALAFQLSPPTGRAGNLSITTPKLTLKEGGTVSVGSLGAGNAGIIKVVADEISLDNNSIIQGTTVSGAGANINLQAQSILLRRGSRISTDAGTSDGGNITLNSNILLAFPQENSDITANARTARGGRVIVNVPNIFGFTAISREQVRDRLGLTDAQLAELLVSPTSLLPTSDIAAISQTSGPALQGTVIFSTSGVNPAQGLVELPQNVVDPTTLIAANLCNRGAGNEFTIAGRGGVPPSPNEALGNTSAQFAWVEGAAGQQGSSGSKNNLPTLSSNDQVIPARGWMMNSLGEVTLLADEPIGQKGQRFWQPISVCAPH